MNDIAMRARERMIQETLADIKQTNIEYGMDVMTPTRETAIRIVDNASKKADFSWHRYVNQ